MSLGRMLWLSAVLAVIAFLAAPVSRPKISARLADEIMGENDNLGLAGA